MSDQRRITDADARRFWAKVSLPSDGGCMLWMAGLDRKGYGIFKLGDRAVKAHRVSLLISAGYPSDPTLQVGHSCRNRHCVAPSHVRWVTAVENAADKVRDGVDNAGIRSGSVKLTERQVLEIRSVAGSVFQRDLAKRYGVHPSTVSAIVLRKRWRHLADNRITFDQDSPCGCLLGPIHTRADHEAIGEHSSNPREDG